MRMRQSIVGCCLAAALAMALTLAWSAPLAAAPSASDSQDKKPSSDADKPDGGKFEPFKPEEKISSGTVTIGGQAISYQAIAGTLIVHPKDWDDVPHDPKADKAPPGSEAGAEA